MSVRTILTAASLALLAVPASALPAFVGPSFTVNTTNTPPVAVTVRTGATTNRNDAVDAYNIFTAPFGRVEADFNPFLVLPQAMEYDTDAGKFTGLGLELGDSSGGGASQGTIQNMPLVRDDGEFGRSNVLNPGEAYLDTNDTLGFTWVLKTPLNNQNEINGLAFFLTDAADQGARVTLTFGASADEAESVALLDGGATNTIDNSQGNSTINFFGLTFSPAVQYAMLEFKNSGSNPNDGFAISNATGLTPVPLPAAAWLLLSGVGGLVIAKRRKS